MKSVERNWNETMKSTKIAIRHRIYTTRDNPEPPKVKLSGQESTRVRKDLARMRGVDVGTCVEKGEFPSKIMQAYYNTCKDCGIGTEDIGEIAEVLVLWSRVAELMRKMKPSESDREEFRSVCRLYWHKKVRLWNAGCWYDRIVGSAMPALLDKFKTLGALNQQSMEGSQNLTQLDLRKAGFGARGRPKKSDIEAGQERWAQVLRERRKAADTPEKWMWEAAVWHFIVDDKHAQLLALVQELLASERIIAWGPFRQAWSTWMATAHVCRSERWRAGASAGARRVSRPARATTWS